MCVTPRYLYIIIELFEYFLLRNSISLLFNYWFVFKMMDLVYLFLLEYASQELIIDLLARFHRASLISYEYKTLSVLQMTFKILYC